MPTTKPKPNQKPKQPPKKTPLTNLIRLPGDALRYGIPQGLVYVTTIPGKAARTVARGATNAAKGATKAAMGMPGRLLKSMQSKKSKKSKK